MPDAIRHLRTLQRTVELVRVTPGRSGRSVRVDADEILIAGDLHGHLANFQTMFKLADLGNHPRRHVVFQEVIHGPFEYPDGSDKSHQLLDLIAAMTVQYPGRVHFLPGNHEFAQMAHRPISKNNRDLNEAFIAGMQYAYGEHSGAIIEVYWKWFQAAPLAVRTANGLFVSHSLPPLTKLGRWDDGCLTRPHDGMELHPGGAVYDLVWGRDVSEAAGTAFRDRVGAEYLITGHVPSENGFILASDRHLIVDCHDVPAACWLGRADGPLTPDEFAASVRLL